MSLKQTVQSAVYALKNRKIEKMILDNQKRLRLSNNYEEQVILITEQQYLIQAKKSFSALLGRVILK